jgi:hypothetical protein
MNRRFIVFCHAVATAAVLGVITAVPASAETALPEWAPPSAATLTIGRSEFTFEGAQWTCQRSAGAFSAGTRLGTFSIDLKECACTGLGQTLELIAVHGEWHLVRLLKSPLHYELLLLFGPDNESAIHLECEAFGFLFLVWGAILGLISQLTPHTAELHFSTEGTTASLKETNKEYLNNAGENVTSELKGKVDSTGEGVFGVTDQEALLFMATAATIKLP